MEKKQTAVNTAEKGACTHKLKCVHCQKEFNPIASKSAKQEKDEPVQQISKTNNVNITLNVQAERKGLFKWIASLFW